MLLGAFRLAAGSTHGAPAAAAEAAAAALLARPRPNPWQQPQPARCLHLAPPFLVEDPVPAAVTTYRLGRMPAKLAAAQQVRSRGGGATTHLRKRVCCLQARSRKCLRAHAGAG